MQIEEPAEQNCGLAQVAYGVVTVVEQSALVVVRTMVRLSLQVYAEETVQAQEPYWYVPEPERVPSVQVRLCVREEHSWPVGAVDCE